MTDSLIHDASRHRFELPLGDGTAAVVSYRERDGVLFLDHTEVPPAHEGKGVGSRLARETFAAIRADGKKAVPLCSFLVRYAARHPEIADVLASGA